MRVKRVVRPIHSLVKGRVKVPPSVVTGATGPPLGGTTGGQTKIRSQSERIFGGLRPPAT